MASWLFRIKTQLDLRPDQTRLVHDTTGLLLTDTFRAYLEAEGYTVQMVGQASALLQLPTHPTTLLTGLAKLPAFAESRFVIRRFTWADIPLMTERSSLLKAMPTPELVGVLDY